MLLLFILSGTAVADTTGIIAGTVTGIDGKPLMGVNITVSGTTRGTISDNQGHYRFENLAPNAYILKFSLIGYPPESRKIIVQPGETTWMNITLHEQPLLMPEITVTPGNFSISQSQTAKQQSIPKENIEAVPATLDDVCRVLQIMPGVTFSDDYSAHFHVRGGKQNENLILLDGMEIYDPYHLKDIGGAVGVINMTLVEDISVLTGGFPAKYGDKLSSVVAVTNRNNPPAGLKGSLTAGGTGANIILQGPSPRGGWVFSFRKSFLKEAAEILNPTDYSFSPSFYDTQGNIVFNLNNNKISLNYLYSRDNSYLERWRQDSDLYADYGNYYYGVVWKKIFTPTLSSDWVLSRGKNFWNNRIGVQREENLELAENVLSYSLNYFPNQHQFELGATYKSISYDYELKTEDLSKSQTELEALIESFYGDTHINPKTWKFAAYLQDKFKLLHFLNANLGFRYDYFEYNRDQQWSPRIGLAANLGKRTILRAAWGHYFQAPVYTELVNQKGSDVNPAAQKSVHYVVGLEHQIGKEFNFRLEGYYKTLEKMIGHFIDFDADNKPYLIYGNPNSGSCKGIEFFINGKITPKFSLWLSYAFSQTRLESYFVNWEKEVIERREIPRFTDQPHNLTTLFRYEMPRHWEFNLKWRYLSGIPSTPRYPAWNASGTAYWRSGETYSARYPDYHRLDLRIGKNFNFKNLELKTFLEIKNAYYHKNVFLYDYKIENNTHVRKVYHMLPLLPTLEFTLVF